MPARARPRSEAELARLWAAQHALGGELATADGTPVQVLYPGRPGGAAGPDFRDAVIQFGKGPPLLGDVELHRTPRDFARHGHAADPAYDNVLLHVVFDAEGMASTVLASGRHAPVLALGSGGSGGLPVREPCATAPARLGAARVQAVLREAGLWRLQQKTGRLAAAIKRDGEGQALYAALAAALGQTANVRPMTLLAEAAPLAEVTAGTAEQGESVAAERMATRLLHTAGLDGALLAPAPALPWAIAGVRPAAHPRRRILALARIVARLGSTHERSGRDTDGAALVAGADATIARALAGDGKGLLALLIVSAPEGGPAYCGRARAVELAINALLPWAAARASNPDHADTILSLADRLPPAETYGPIRHLTRNLCNNRGRSLLTTALLQQGALAMLGEWCRRGGCGRCPLS
jgi:hypothetical protein